MSNEKPDQVGFGKYNLLPTVFQALEDVGYETPTPIQDKMIPHVLAGKDVIGQAPTGTGKTAAFALPLLSRIDLANVRPQVLVLAPTRELAIQVSEAFHRYAVHLKNFHVVPIYGGQDYSGQLRQLKRGVHVVVGTPGRVMDHMRRKSLKLDSLQALVLDEADEMLRMGFIDDVEWILEQTPPTRQIALFSATMPAAIRRIAQNYLNEPEEVNLKVHLKSETAIRQRYWVVSGIHKLDALTRILEGETFDGILIFARTKIATTELVEKLEARGYSSSALNGDMSQSLREQTVKRFKSGKLDILVATDVAARGLDIDRISHVINYDIPSDTESYIHRIGRTGRAGRSGEAILFITPRERRMLRDIERATNQQISLMELPSTDTINDKRIAAFKDRISDTLAMEDLGFFYQLIEQYRQEHNVPVLEIASALAKMMYGDQPFLLSAPPKLEPEPQETKKRKSGKPRKSRPSHDLDMERYRVDVGRNHGVAPGNIVGAIVNEAGIDRSYIGQIDIFDSYSTVDLPIGMPKKVLQILQKIRVFGQKMNAKVFDGRDATPSANKRGKKKDKPKSEKSRKKK